MLRAVETHKTVFLNNKFDNNQKSFEKNINVEFIPDEIIVKYITVKNDNIVAEKGVYMLKTNLVRDEILISFPCRTTFTSSVDIPFKNYDRINGTYSFTLNKIDYSGIANLANMDLSLSLVLMFVKYKSE